MCVLGVFFWFSGGVGAYVLACRVSGSDMGLVE